MRAFDEGQVKQTYAFENNGEDGAYAKLELTDAEAAVVRRVIDALNEGREPYAPTLVMEKE